MQTTTKTLHTFGLMIGLLLLSFVAEGQPGGNPFQIRYSRVLSSPIHWTDSLLWNVQFPVATYGATIGDASDDRAAVQAAIDAAAAAGGGMVYFAAGTYVIGDSLIMRTGVILRGPTPAVADALDSTYRPLAKLQFPAYVFDTTANGGQGTNNNTAFKHISAAPNAHNMAIIDLDINRARLVFQPYQWQDITIGTRTTKQPVDVNHNVLIMGVRSNNTAIPAPSVPALTSHRPWQRFCWRFAANIDVYASRNAIICNNRLNDSTTDNFNQPNYRTVPRAQNPTQVMPSDGSGAAFSYTNHYGIALNRNKLKRNGPATGAAATGPLNSYGIYGVVPLASPEEEPQLYAPGNLVLDNYIYKTMRIGVWAGGNGLRVSHNTIRDAQNKRVYLSPDGVNFLNPIGPTFENRGIDFSGWDIEVADNDIEVHQHRYNTYGTTDGESILLQELGGGTIANDIQILRNKIKASGGLLSLFKIGDISNVVVKHNEFIGDGAHEIQISANRNGDPNHYLNSTIVDSNTNVGAVILNGSLGGTPCYFRHNTGKGTSRLNVACHVILDANTGFAAPQINNEPCPTTVAFPSVEFVNLRRDTVFYSLISPAVLTLRVRCHNADPATSTARLYLGSQVVASGTFDPVDSTLTFRQTIGVGADYGGYIQYRFTVKLETTNPAQNTFSEQREVTFILYEQTKDRGRGAIGASISPNPSTGEAWLKIDQAALQTGSIALALSTTAGQRLWSGTYAANASSGANSGKGQAIPLGQLPKGMYILKMSGQKGSSTLPLIKQ